MDGSVLGVCHLKILALEVLEFRGIIVVVCLVLPFFRQ
jgi:hypothetical protein